MPVLFEYATASLLAYELEAKEYDQQAFIGWQLLSRSPQNARGFFAVAFYKQNDTTEITEIIISFRGTQPTNWKNIITDFGLALGSEPNTQDLANKFVKDIIGDYPEANISLTGHSLGATLAEVASIQVYQEKKRQLEAITMDSPGIPTVVFKKLNDYQTDNIRCYLPAPNLVNSLGHHVGRMHRLSLRPMQTTYAHLISCVLGSFSRTLLWSATLTLITGALFKSLSGNNDQLNYGANPNTRVPLLIEAVGGWYLGKYFANWLAEQSYASATLKTMLPFFSGLGALLGAAPSAYSDYHWLVERHHSIKRIVDATRDDEQHKPDIKVAHRWPNFHENIINHAAHQVYSLIPFYKANRGVHTFFNEEKVVEEQIQHMYGLSLAIKK